jgi:hypothetical protein
LTRNDIDAALAEYKTSYTDPRWQVYLPLHHERYHVLMGEALRLIGNLSDSPPRVLVIGPRFEVGLFHVLVPDAIVDTLGINPGLFPLRGGGRYFEFNLADADLPAKRPSPGRYALIVMAEVLEHVPMPPSTVLPWLASLLVPGGYLLVQTPNAVALQNRLRMLIGSQPFQRLSEDRASPAHFREYTIGELIREGRTAGLAVARVQAMNYFLTAKRSNRLFRRAERFLPPTLRAGITISYQSPPAPTP